MKFRAWILEWNTIVDVELIELKARWISHENLRQDSMFDDEPVSWTDPYVVTPLDKCHLMEFTGLTDKNGRDIYESDILKGAGIVAWNDANVRWSCIDIEWNDRREWHDMLYLTTPLEVIGNIYDNPELLKEANEESS